MIANMWTIAKPMHGVQKIKLLQVAGKFAYTKVKHSTKQKALFLFLVMCTVRGNR